VTTAIGAGEDFAEGVAVQSNGKIVAAGASSDDFAVARYLEDGSLDAAFGGDGTVTTPVSAGFDEARSVAVQPNGKIVAAGRAVVGATPDFALVRYDADGSLDSSFGSGGLATTPIGAGLDEALAVAILPGGKIIAAGRSFDGTAFDFAVVRYTKDGELDTSFGDDGIVTTDFASADDRAFAVAVEHGGRVVAAGHTCSAGGCDFALARYLSDGTLDATFDGDGRVVTAPGPGSGGAFAVAVARKHKIVAAGLRCVGADCDFALARYDDDGTLDPGFGSGGTVLTSFGPGVDETFGLTVRANGTIVAGGQSYSGTDFDFAAARYLKDGTLDSSFGAGGKVTTQIGAGDDTAASLALAPGGDIVLAGRSSNGTDDDFALVRYLGS
jgi:uncharacterized delta-60 repeat protein